MRYMILVKHTYQDEVSPRGDFDDLLVEMGKYNQQLIDAGVMLAGEGLQPSSSGARVQFSKDKAPSVKDGPFTESKELVGGFWIIKAKDLAEAVEWAKKIPFKDGEVEVRRVSEVEDFTSNEKTAETLQAEQTYRDTGKWPDAGSQQQQQ